jgi:perosamine synthetase
MKPIPQVEPWFGSEEKKSINEYLDEGGWITEYKRTALFESMIAEYTKTKHCIVVNNGTISLTLGALAAGIKAQDEVIVPNYTMIATANCLKMFGAEPVFVDVERQTLCLDIDLVKKAITPKTRAVFLVTANGRYPQSGIEAFERLCKEHELMLFEDTAQSLGSFYPDGRHQGSVGVFGSFSFSTPKIISTGQGGAVITNDEKIAFKVRRLKDFGRSGGGLDIHDSIGYNFKFTELQACVGIEQMKKLPWRVERKKQILQLYRKYLSGIQQVSMFEQDLSCTTPWFIDILAEKREELMKFLKAGDIGTRVMYPPINHQKAYQVPGEHKISNLVGERGLWLPSSSKLEDGEIEYICEMISRFYRSR